MQLSIVDPDGVKERRRNAIRRRVYQTSGPNHVCHLDGNNKLKKWGFGIHGAVDGFTRKLLWLKVSSTNYDPLVVATFYLNHIKEHGLRQRL